MTFGWVTGAPGLGILPAAASQKPVVCQRNRSMARKPSGSRASSVPTLIDVARLAGVSPVSRAMGRPEVVRPATRRWVQEGVRATGYVLNLAAGALATSRSRLVAIFLPTIANPIFADTVQALTEHPGRVRLPDPAGPDRLQPAAGHRPGTGGNPPGPGPGDPGRGARRARATPAGR